MPCPDQGHRFGRGLSDWVLVCLGRGAHQFFRAVHREQRTRPGRDSQGAVAVWAAVWAIGRVKSLWSGSRHPIQTSGCRPHRLPASVAGRDPVAGALHAKQVRGDQAGWHRLLNRLAAHNSRKPGNQKKLCGGGWGDTGLNISRNDVAGRRTAIPVCRFLIFDGH